MTVRDTFHKDCVWCGVQRKVSLLIQLFFFLIGHPRFGTCILFKWTLFRKYPISIYEFRNRKQKLITFSTPYRMSFLMAVLPYRFLVENFLLHDYINIQAHFCVLRIEF